jgi:hypothetical protein
VLEDTDGEALDHLLDPKKQVANFRLCWRRLRPALSIIAGRPGLLGA